MKTKTTNGNGIALSCLKETPGTKVIGGETTFGKVSFYVPKWLLGVAKIDALKGRLTWADGEITIQIRSA